MRLLGCHINGFGKFQEADFDLNENVKIFCEDNGWGKTTLSTFIRVMLYGFEGDQKRDDVANERRHYKPWAGGIYGGRLDIEAAGVEYSIIRTFGNKKNDDTLEVRNRATNMVVGDLGEEPGRTLFDLDSESFSRSVFLSHNDCATAATDNINAKLGNLTDNTDDINSYEKIVKKIEAEINALGTARSGLLKKLSQDRTDLEHKVRNRHSIENAAAELEDKIKTHRDYINGLKSRSDEIGSIMDKESEAVTNRARKEKYEEIIKNTSEREQKLSDVKSFFKNDIPEDEDIEKINVLNEKLISVKSEFDSYRLLEDEKNKLRELANDFESGVPEEQDFASLLQKINRIKDIDKELRDKEMPRSDRERLNELQDKYADNMPSTEEVAEVVDSLERRADLQQELDRKRSSLDVAQMQNGMVIEKAHEKHISRRNVLLAVAAIMLIGGAALGFIISVPVPFVKYIGFGLLVASVLDIVLALRKEKAVEENAVLSELRDTVEDYENRINELNNNIEGFAKRYGFHAGSSMLMHELLNSEKEIEEYTKLIKKSNEFDPEPLYEERDELANEINVFLMKYNEEPKNEEYFAVANKLNNKAREYKRLMSQSEKADEAQHSIRKCRSDIEAYLNSQGLKPKNDKEYAGYIRELMDNKAKYGLAKIELDAARKAQDIFEEENPDHLDLLKVEDSSKEISLSDLNEERMKLDAEIEKQRGFIKEYETRLDELSKELDEIYECEEKLEEVNATIDDTKKRYDNFVNVKKYLIEAKENLTNRYTGPILASFSKYQKILDVSDNAAYRIDANIAITKEDSGMQRDTRLLSSGQQDLVGFCLRLAMIDAMYSGEKPFIVLDDPFINLDTDKAAQASVLLRALGRDYQILYFTCNESRK